jgi:hypothetical protein
LGRMLAFMWFSSEASSSRTRGLVQPVMEVEKRLITKPRGSKKREI